MNLDDFFGYDVEHVYHAAMCSAHRGHSTQARKLFNLAESLRNHFGLAEDTRWRQEAINAQKR